MNSTSKLKLDRSIFWDVNFKELNWRANRDFIIGRVLKFGDINDYKETVRLYGHKQIKSVFRATRDLDSKSANFWQLIF